MVIMPSHPLTEAIISSKHTVYLRRSSLRLQFLEKYDKVRKKSALFLHIVRRDNDYAHSNHILKSCFDICISILSIKDNVSPYFPYDWCYEIKCNQKSDIMNSFTTSLITPYFPSEWTLVTTKKVNPRINISKFGVRFIISRRNIQILFAQILFFGMNVFIICSFPSAQWYHS